MIVGEPLPSTNEFSRIENKKGLAIALKQNSCIGHVFDITAKKSQTENDHYMSISIRISILIIILAIILLGISGLFWTQELRYQLPTPLPAGYKEVSIGAHVALPAALGEGTAHFLHFYNPDCPCSRFNAKHLRSLIGEYNDSIRITIVVPHIRDLKSAEAEFGNQINLFVDNNRVVASACGVYSTPQAAIVRRDGKLYYRGNYNVSRYCSARATNFAELSLIALLNNQPSPSFGLSATQSYGCELTSEEMIAF